MTESTSTNPPEEQVKLRDVLKGFRGFWQELKRKWFWIVLLGVVLGGINAFNAYRKEVRYFASLTFMVNEDEGGSAVGVGSLLNQFGLGSAGGGDYNLEKIRELSTSMRIIRAALFTKVTIGGTSDYLANHLIRAYELDKQWEEDQQGLEGFLFRGDNVDNFSLLENTALKQVYYLVKGMEDAGIQGLMGIKVNATTSIFDMTVLSKNEKLSINLLETLYEKLSTFYVNEAIEKSKATVDLLKVQVDSIGGRLRSKEYQLAQTYDSNRGLITRTAQLEQDRLQREVQILNIEYAENLKQLKIADFALKNATPFFQEIDMPIAPLSKKKPNVIKAIVFGGLLGAVLAIIIILFRKIIRDALAEEG